MTGRSVMASAAIVLGMVLLSSSGTAQGPRNEPRFVANEVLVQFHYGSSPAARAAARARVSGVLAEVVAAENRRGDGKGDLELVRIPPGLAVADAARGLQGDAAVEFAEPNWIYEHQAQSNDPYYTNGSLWGMYGDATTPANQYGSQAGEAWANGNVGSSGVYVVIIDEGVQTTHQDLSANIWTNPFDPIDGVDNDGNGYIDDTNGWDFVSNNRTVYDGPQDDHATHVAGTIGAVGGNGKGVVGVNWNVTMISAKFLGSGGGTTANAIKAVDYATDLKTRHGLNLTATNNSWGGGGFSQSLLDAINRGGNAGILFVAAAGNGGSDGIGDDNDASPFYPASYQCSSSNGDCVIAVAAITSSGAKSGFSNFGLTRVDLGAPGSSIYSTLPGRGNKSGYGAYSGTSMATPHVTGAAALYAASHPSATAAEIKAAILNSTVSTASLTGKTVTGGRLNVSGF
ncbi:MAG: S8 family peptidase [Acidobacteriota bacterium]